MNREDRPEHVLDPHRGLDVATGMRYTADDEHAENTTRYGLGFVNNDHTQSIKFRKDDHTVSIRGTPSLNHIISEAEDKDVNKRGLLRERINRYDDIEQAAMDIQNIGGCHGDGVIKSLQAEVTRTQTPWKNRTEHDDTADEALTEHRTHPPRPDQTHNEATQTRIRRHVTKRCYAVSLLYQGVNHVIQDMMRRLNADRQVLSVHYNNDNAPDVLDDTNYDRSIRRSVGDARDELSRISEELNEAQHSMKRRGDTVAEALPAYARNDVKGTYQDVSTVFS